MLEQTYRITAHLCHHQIQFHAVYFLCTFGFSLHIFVCAPNASRYTKFMQSGACLYLTRVLECGTVHNKCYKLMFSIISIITNKNPMRRWKKKIAGNIWERCSRMIPSQMTGKNYLIRFWVCKLRVLYENIFFLVCVDSEWEKLFVMHICSRCYSYAFNIPVVEMWCGGVRVEKTICTAFFPLFCTHFCFALLLHTVNINNDKIKIGMEIHS